MFNGRLRELSEIEFKKFADTVTAISPNTLVEMARGLAIPQHFSNSDKGVSDYFSNSLINSLQ